MISFPVILINSLSVLTICMVIAVVWRRRADTGAAELIVLTVFMLIWAVASFIEMVVHGLGAKILWRNITQIGTFGTPAAALIFSIAYTGILRNHIKRLSFVIYVVQAVFVLFIVTDSWHHLARIGIFIVRGDLFETLVVSTSIATRVLISINFFYMAVSLTFLITALFSIAPSMKKQIWCVLAGMLICIVYSLVKVSSNESFGLMVPISGVFALANVSMLFGIFRYDLLMLAPIARNEVFNVVGEGIIVAAANGKIVDVNRAALKIFNACGDDKRTDAIFDCVERDIAQSYPGWYDAMVHSRAGRFHISIENGGSQNHYLCDVYSVNNNNKKKLIGSISVIKDITEQKRNIDLLKVRAEKDGLTGTNNRKTFIERVERMLEHYNEDVCLLFIDIDYFKSINDNYGHVFGDQALIKVCELIQARLDKDAFMGRMGGEEFAVFQRVTHTEQTTQFAESLRRCISEYRFCFNGNSVHITISIGGAAGRFASFDALYHIADTNLYKAKGSGRNCVKF
jgi:diguanylate cyclase (GGDEF)-like protein